MPCAASTPEKGCTSTNKVIADHDKFCQESTGKKKEKKVQGCEEQELGQWPITQEGVPGLVRFELNPKNTTEGNPEDHTRECYLERMFYPKILRWPHMLITVKYYIIN